jgi:hypothetical protein
MQTRNAGRRFSAEFHAGGAIEAIRGRETALANKCELDQMLIVT